MQIDDQIVTVGEGGRIGFQVARPAGARVRVIVLDESSAAADASITVARPQDNSGFARQVLANPAEDVWNDL